MSCSPKVWYCMCDRQLLKKLPFYKLSTSFTISLAEESQVEFFLVDAAISLGSYQFRFKDFEMMKFGRT